MWRYLNRILPTNYLLSKRGFNLKPCQNFGNFEDLNHVFFDCPLYVTMWVDVKGINKILNIPIHNMPEALFQIELCSRPEKLKKLAYIFLAFAIHHTWVIRNDIKHNQLKINHNQFKHMLRNRTKHFFTQKFRLRVLPISWYYMDTQVYFRTTETLSSTFEITNKK